MAVVTPEKYNDVLDSAKNHSFALPAINVTSSQTAIAVLKGLTEANSDGIIQVSVGGAEYLSGSNIKDRVAGSLALATFVKQVAKNYPINVALHTDHCIKENLDSWVVPLLEYEAKQISNGENPAFQSHMFDGSTISLDENLVLTPKLLEMSKKAKTILEIEIGVVGGEEDGHEAEINEKLYTTVEDGLKVAEKLGLGEKGRYLTAFTFGNVHGVYKPGAVKLRPEILRDIQKTVGEKYNSTKPFDMVFHGGSGSTEQEIANAVSYGVIKMNVDTDTQYAFSRPIADHVFKGYDGILKIDGDVGNKKVYDPRSWGKVAEEGMAQRVVEAATRLGSAGNHIK